METKNIETGSAHYATYQARRRHSGTIFILSLAIVAVTASLALMWRACEIATTVPAAARGVK
jgi:hypothetical protein